MKGRGDAAAWYGLSQSLQDCAKGFATCRIPKTQDSWLHFKQLPHGAVHLSPRAYRRTYIQPFIERFASTPFKNPMSGPILCRPVPHPLLPFALLLLTLTSIAAILNDLVKVNVFKVHVVGHDWSERCVFQGKWKDEVAPMEGSSSVETLRCAEPHGAWILRAENVGAGVLPTWHWGCWRGKKPPPSLPRPSNDMSLDTRRSRSLKRGDNFGGDGVYLMDSASPLTGIAPRPAA